MGVLACDRVGCENIMCDRCSPTYGYICELCFKELVESGVDTHLPSFMATPFKKELEWTAEAEEKFDKEFPDA